MKTVLVTVSGMSPAIITETVWALSQESPHVVPDEVVVITTEKGEADINNTLLSSRDDWGGKTVWGTLRERLLSEENGEALQLSIRVIEVPNPETGVKEKADDLRSGADNDAAANFIIQVLAPYADAEDCRVIASIAGGRKTMGALLYAAMNLLGKEGDRVTHVLVSEPFETCRGFFYPEQPAKNLEARRFGQDPITVNASAAKVEMADLAFVPLRNKFVELNEPRLTFSGLVEQYSRAPLALDQGPPRVDVDIDRDLMIVQGRKIPLSGKNLIVAAFLQRRAEAGEPHFVNADDAKVPLKEFFEAFKKDAPFHKALQRLHTLDPVDLPKALSGIRKKLKENGLEGAIDHLAPERQRIGFDIDPSS